MTDSQKPDQYDSLLRSTSQQQRLRECLTANQEDKLIASLTIAIDRARTRHAPQQVVIQITDKGYCRFIDPTDNSGPVE